MTSPTLDHVALRVSDRAASARELTEQLDVEVIETTDRFTLVGADFASGKITLLDSEDGSVPAAGRVVSIMLSSGGDSSPPPLQLRDGLIITFAPTAVLGPDWQRVPRHSLVGISLRACDPPLVAAEMERWHGMHVDVASRDVAVIDVGADPTNGRLALSRERWKSDVDRQQMLDHVGIRVADADAWRMRAAASGVEVVRWVDAPRSRAVFVAGPDELLIEYVEHVELDAAP